LIVGAAAAGAVLIITMVVVFFHCLRKRAKIVEEIQQSEDGVQQEKEGDIIHDDSHFDAHHASHMSEFKIAQNEGKRASQGLNE
jgi:hypothetical protein